MLILHIDETFHPAFGYQINSLAKFQKKEGNDIYIITTDKDHLHPAFKFSNDNEHITELDEEYEKMTGVRILRAPVRKYISNRAVFSWKLFKMIDQIKPDVIMLHQVETYASIIYILKRYYKRYPTLFDSHMLRMASNNRFVKIYNYVFKKIITPRLTKNSIRVIKTQNDDYVNSVLGIPESLTPFVSFGSDLILFNRNPENRKAFRRKNNIDEEDFVVVYTGKMDAAKGGKLLAEAFKQKIVLHNNRKIVFIVVGNTYDDEYGHEVEKDFSLSENRIIRFATQRYIDLPIFYQSADLCVFAKQCSLSFYDAQACGIPVVFEDNNINIDRASHNNGTVFKSGDVGDFRSKIMLYGNMSYRDWLQQSENAIQFVRSTYGYDKIAAEYTRYMELAIQSFNARSQ